MSLDRLVRRGRPAAEIAPGRSSGPFIHEPRVSLLPPELRAVEAVRATRRKLVGGVVVAAVVVALSITASAGAQVAAEVRLALAQQQTSDLSKDVARYAAVGQLQNRVQLTRTAVRVGSSTAIDWRSYLKRIDAVTPSAFGITSVSINSASPLLAFPQGTTSIDQVRAGTIALTAQAASIDDLPAWLNGLATLPGYADASPNVAAGATPGSYLVIVTMHITDGAFVTPITQGVAK